MNGIATRALATIHYFSSFGEPIVAGRIIEAVDNQYRQPNESPQTEQEVCVRLGDGRFEEHSIRVFSLSTTLEQHITFDFDVEQ